MSQTWMSGGSGSGVYDPVTTTDNVQFSDTEEFRVKGGRIYNFGTYRKSGMKAVCDEIRNRSRPKCLLIVFATTLVLILMVLAIAIAASHDKSHGKPSKPSTNYEAWQNKTTGLMFLPKGVDDSAYIHFSLEQQDQITGIRKAMDEELTKYHILRQQDPIFDNCNASHAPPDRVCKIPLSEFGTECTSLSSYGYKHNTPCVLLLLQLPQNWTIRAYEPKDGELYTEAEKALGSRYSPTHVGITCEPATPEDEKNLHNRTTRMEYNPPKGFPSWVYRPRTVSQFLTPAVMVHFKTLLDFKPTRINCRTWGEVVDSLGQRVKPEDFTTSFVLHIDSKF